MSTDLKNTIILASSFLVLFGVAELLYHKFNVKAELTRKVVHIGTGLITLSFPEMISNPWLVLLLCSSFAIILITSLRFNFLKSINAIDRESMGSLAYPVSVFVCFLAFKYFGNNYSYFYLPILILALCDPIAALTGRRWPLGKFDIGGGNKTIVGTSMFFISALGLSLLLGQQVFVAFLVAIVSAFVESISPRGSDNLTIPGSVLLTLILCVR